MPTLQELATEQRRKAKNTLKGLFGLPQFPQGHSSGFKEAQVDKFVDALVEATLLQWQANLENSQEKRGEIPV